MRDTRCEKYHLSAHLPQGWHFSCLVSCITRGLDLPDDNNKEVEGVPYTPNVSPRVEYEPIGNDFHEAFQREDHHKDDLDLFLQQDINQHYSLTSDNR